MARAPRIYTRSGDDGTTGLVGGGRLSKNHPRIQCFGTLDECSSAIGLARRALADKVRSPRTSELDAWLAWIQDALFNLGSELATPPKNRSEAMPRIAQSDVDALERAIDRAEADLPALDTFILPGGSLAGGFLNLARTMCRRAERRMVALDDADPIDPIALRFANRLSDALFVWARWINREFGEPEHRWNPSTKPPA